MYYLNKTCNLIFYTSPMNINSGHTNKHNGAMSRW